MKKILSLLLRWHFLRFDFSSWSEIAEVGCEMFCFLSFAYRLVKRVGDLKSWWYMENWFEFAAILDLYASKIFLEKEIY